MIRLVVRPIGDVAKECRAVLMSGPLTDPMRVAAWAALSAAVEVHEMASDSLADPDFQGPDHSTSRAVMSGKSYAAGRVIREIASALGVANTVEGKGE